MPTVNIPIVLIKIYCIYFNIPVGSRAACGVTAGLYFSFYIRHLQSHVIQVNLMTGEGSNIATGLSSFASLILILIMQIKSIGWNGSGWWLIRETTMSSWLWHMICTICCMTNWILHFNTVSFPPSRVSLCWSGTAYCPYCQHTKVLITPPRQHFHTNLRAPSCRATPN